MKNKEVSSYKRIPPEQLQEFLAFQRKGGKVPAKKGKGSYNRKNFKRGE